MSWGQRPTNSERIERQLDAELRFHFDSVVAENVRGGMDESEARRRARLQFGGIEQVKEECREARSLRWMDDVLRDLRFALRSLRKSPGFTITAIATLALGIGVNVAVFSVVNAVLLKPLKAPEADRIVRIMDTYQGVPSQGNGYKEFNVWRRETNVFEDISAYRLDLINLTGGSYPELIPVARVSEGFFRLFGAPVFQGRFFTPDEDRPGGGHVAVLSNSFWARRYGKDPHVVGQSIILGSEPYVVAGILGPGFDTEQFDQLPDVWVPIQIEPNTQDGGSFCFSAARLKSGVTLAMANAHLQAAAEEYRRLSPNPRSQAGFTAQPVLKALVSDVRSSLLLLAGAVGFVLLIACTNVANLSLVRADGRKREVALRAALGGGRGRIVLQLLTESLVLSAAAGVLGLLFGFVGIRALLSSYPSEPLLTAWNPVNLPRIGHAGSAVTLDWRVVALTVLLSLATGILFGILPALRASRTDLSTPLKENSGRSGAGLRSNKTRSLLVISEVTLALVMLIGAVLMIRAYVALRLVNPGFDAHNVLTMQMSLTATRFEKSAEMSRLTNEGAQGIRGLPGVESASAACCRPLELVWQLPYIVSGRPLSGTFHGYAGWTFISPQYFDVFRVPVLRGRTFTERDNAQAPSVVIINQALARLLAKTFTNGREPLHERLIIGRGMRPEYEEDSAREIVGIVGDMLDTSLNRNPRPAMYVPIAQLPDGINLVNLRLLPIAWFVRTTVTPQSLSAPIQNELRQASGGLPVTSIRSMEEVQTRSLARQDFNMLLMSIFGGSALLLSAIGIYGLIAYTVDQRTQEIGVRMALGAPSSRVRNMIVFQGMRPALIGVALGIAAACGLSRLLTSLLFGVQPRDPVTFVGVPVVLMMVALIACWLPARRATRINPSEALRYE